MDTLYLILTLQFPGFFVPKPSPRMKRILVQGTSQDKRELLKGYIKRLADYQYLIQHPSFKQFIEKKMEIKKHITEASSSSYFQGLPQGQNLVAADPFEVADRFREVFGYLMEVPIQDQDYKIIDRFDQFIKAKIVELDALKNELKAIHAKCVAEYRAEGKLY
jgi:hypothetical protein